MFRVRDRVSNRVRVRVRVRFRVRDRVRNRVRWSVKYTFYGKQFSPCAVYRHCILDEMAKCALEPKT